MSDNSYWQPSASIASLKARAKIMQNIRDFFAKRDVLEVESPILSDAAVTDLHLHSLSTTYHFPNSPQAKKLYLHTSPEFYMKRLLAAGSGSIYQIAKVFRDFEQGRLHHGEFTMLEWYRVGFDYQQLMDEVDQLIQLVLKTKPAKKISYQALFLEYLNIDPHLATTEALIAAATQVELDTHCLANADKNTCLDFLMSEFLEKKLAKLGCVFVYDYPASQAALAKINPNTNCALRFECYVNGIELANGFQELTNATEQRMRFEQDLLLRKNNNLPEVPIDEAFLQALTHGLPECSGVALGIDRLMMLALKKQKIQAVMLQ